MAEVECRYGRTIYFSDQDARGRELARSNGVPYPNSLRLWELALGLVPEWDLVLDIGSNYGEMLAGIESVSASRVVAFEPNPLILPYLSATLSNLPWPVELADVAVGSQDAELVHLDVDAEWSGVTHLAPPGTDTGGELNRVTVSQVSLDSFCAPYPRSLCLKVDVEGYEMQVLSGGAGLIASADYAVVMIEILHMPVQDVLELARKYPLYLLDIPSQQLVRWNGADGYQLGRALHSGQLYRQDALLIAGARGADLDADLRETTDTTAAREERLTAANRGRVAEVERLRGKLAEAEAALGVARAENATLASQRDEALAHLTELRQQHESLEADLRRTFSLRAVLPSTNPAFGEIHDGLIEFAENLRTRRS
ncbi:FkbM family methyltransferase [Tessaracoccus lacteus]|uniref:FkbM family methyltransferase n=1 Tax=Tessaracoccus lacteus TaxID=3041766 RepID=A0ABY8PXA3_9ACTN|nr:FkbM family methyltransferase [Tessaracoccus sp. T21]WGT47037.1 FkbM family methyltransferase [Tessaracoccus sp. T21]